MSEQIIPFEGQAYTREVLLQTSAEWAQTPDYVLQAYQTGRETDTGREKTGTGYTVWADLPYDSPDGSPFTADGIDDLANGVPEPTDRVPIVTDITGVAATATITVGSVVSPTLLTVGSATFTLVDSIDVELPQIEIGETPAATATSIIDAINDEDYAELCGCSAEIDGGDDTLINLTASATGVAGDDIILVSTDADELTVTAFSGGVDAEAVLRKVTVADLGGGGGGGVNISVLSTATVATDVGTKQALYTVPAGKVCIVTNVVVRNPSASLASYDTGESLTFGFDNTASDYNNNIIGTVVALLQSPLDYYPSPCGILSPAVAGIEGDVFGCRFDYTAIEATVDIDVIGYLVDA